MRQIAVKLGAEIVYHRTFFRFDNEIVLAPGSPEEEWMNFGHEICHFLRHCGNQANLHPLFIELQEWQADNFMYQFCAPTFMLKKMKLPDHEDAAVDMLCKTFCVLPEFARRRLQQYIRNHLQRGWCTSS